MFFQKLLAATGQGQIDLGGEDLGRLMGQLLAGFDNDQVVTRHASSEI